MVVNRPDWCIFRQRTWRTDAYRLRIKDTGSYASAYPELMEAAKRAAVRIDAKEALRRPVQSTREKWMYGRPFRC